MIYASDKSKKSSGHETVHKDKAHEKAKQKEHDRKKDDNEKFSPGQADNYDPEEFNTD